MAVPLFIENYLLVRLLTLLLPNPLTLLEANFCGDLGYLKNRNLRVRMYIVQLSD